MSRRISVEIGRDGRLQVEYSGYPGETCFEEAEVLSKALRELGLWAIPVTVTRKSASQIEVEVGAKESPGKEVPVG
jgi:hypothetical protein